MTSGSDSRPEDNDSIEIAYDLELRVGNLSKGYRTCPECGRGCEPVPFDAEARGIRVSFICPLHGVHTVIDPFEGSR